MSERRAVAVSGADTHHRLHRADEDLAVTDLTGAGGIRDRLDHVFHPVVFDDHFDLQFLQELHGEL